ncbi:MAG: SPOR domain-containing protein [Gammaproteobacteria bacterium]
MRVRRLSPMLLVMAIVACSAPEKVVEERSDDVLPTQLPAAEIPTYAKGDRYIYDNPEEVWTIVGLQDGLVTWESSLGETRTTMFDPLLPPVKWQKSDESGGSRQILEWSGGLFPLKAGNKLTYKDSVKLDGDTGHALFVWNCYAGNPRRLHVPAGDFATVPVFCRRSDGHKLHAYYAPALYNAASLVLTAPDGKVTTRNLISFEPGKGARVAAPRQESLPGGWSAAVIADWQSDVAGLPRVRPEQVADANPPVGLAGPTDRSRNADELPRTPRKPERTMLAFHAPKIKVPSLRTPTTVTATVPAEPKPRYGAHVGSFSSREGAERAWGILGKKSETLRKTADFAVVPVDLGAPKGVMYRLLAGPTASKADANRLCEALKAESGYCRVLSFKS